MNKLENTWMEPNFIKRLRAAAPSIGGLAGYAADSLFKYYKKNHGGPPLEGAINERKFFLSFFWSKILFSLEEVLVLHIIYMSTYVTYICLHM